MLRLTIRLFLGLNMPILGLFPFHSPFINYLLLNFFGTLMLNFPNLQIVILILGAQILVTLHAHFHPHFLSILLFILQTSENIPDNLLQLQRRNSRILIRVQHFIQQLLQNRVIILRIKLIFIILQIPKLEFASLEVVHRLDRSQQPRLQDDKPQPEDIVLIRVDFDLHFAVHERLEQMRRQVQRVPVLDVHQLRLLGHRGVSQPVAQLEGEFLRLFLQFRLVHFLNIEGHFRQRNILRPEILI